MNLKPGDKVSFLNEKRDGIVKKILNNKMVLVEISDGFDIPVLEHDLVKVQVFDESYGRTTKSKEADEKLIYEEEQAAERFPQRHELNTIQSEQNKTRSGIYLAFIPEDPDDVMSSNFGVYLINHNSHDLLFTYSLKEENNFICKDFDRLDEESAILLDIIDKTDIEKWKDLQFQFLFFKKDASINKQPVVRDMHIKPIRFYKENNYSDCSLINEKCILVSLSDKEKHEPEEWAEEKWENKVIEKPSGLKIIGHINDMNKPAPFPEIHILEKGIAEVDLHIEELMENYSGKENFELLTIQLEYFSKMIENAIVHKFKKIIFIHGVGNGKLKQEIITKLKNNYPDLKYNDASFLRYGKGATEVILN